LLMVAPFVSPPLYATPDDLWRAALTELQLQMTKATFNTWLIDSCVLAQVSTLTCLIISVRNRYAQEWLTHRLRSVIVRTLSSIAGYRVEVHFVYDIYAKEIIMNPLENRLQEYPSTSSGQALSQFDDEPAMAPSLKRGETFQAGIVPTDPIKLPANITPELLNNFLNQRDEPMTDQHNLINANRVKPELRDRIITYQRECYQVLAAAFLDPAAAVERLRQLYRQKGYSDRWIDSRLRSISVRNELTDEWKQHGVEEDAEFAVLTAVISKGTFGIMPAEHRNLKGLNRQNLRDHMTNEELVFTMLGELATTRIARRDDAQGFDENKEAAQEGGDLAGDARQKFEAQTGALVLSSRNFLEQPEAQDSLPFGNDASESDEIEEDA